MINEKKIPQNLRTNVFPNRKKTFPSHNWVESYTFYYPFIQKVLQILDDYRHSSIYAVNVGTHKKLQKAKTV